MTLDDATVRALRLVDVEAMQSARDNREYDPQAMPTVWYWPADGYDSIKRVDAATIRALAADWLAMRAVLEEVRPYIIEAIADAKAEHDMNRPYPMREERFRAYVAEEEAVLTRLDAVLKGGER